MMSDGATRAALIAGIFLVALGTLLLIENLYRSISLWDFLAKYWPVILILLGLRSWHRYFTFKPE